MGKKNKRKHSNRHGRKRKKHVEKQKKQENMDRDPESMDGTNNIQCQLNAARCLEKNEESKKNSGLDGDTEDQQNGVTCTEEPQNIDGATRGPQNTDGIIGWPQNINGSTGGPQNIDGATGGPQNTDGIIGWPQNIDGSTGGPQNIDGDTGRPQNIDGGTGGPQNIDGDTGRPQNIDGATGGPQNTDGVIGWPQNIDGSTGGPQNIDGATGGTQNTDGIIGWPQNIDGSTGGPQNIDGDTGRPQNIDGGTGGTQNIDGDTGRPQNIDGGTGGPQDNGDVTAGELNINGATRSVQDVYGTNEDLQTIYGATEIPQNTDVNINKHLRQTSTNSFTDGLSNLSTQSNKTKTYQDMGARPKTNCHGKPYISEYIELVPACGAYSNKRIRRDTRHTFSAFHHDKEASQTMYKDNSPKPHGNDDNDTANINIQSLTSQDNGDYDTENIQGIASNDAIYKNNLTCTKRPILCTEDSNKNKISSENDKHTTPPCIMDQGTYKENHSTENNPSTFTGKNNHAAKGCNKSMTKQHNPCDDTDDNEKEKKVKPQTLQVKRKMKDIQTSRPLTKSTPNTNNNKTAITNSAAYLLFRRTVNKKKDFESKINQFNDHTKLFSQKIWETGDFDRKISVIVPVSSNKLWVARENEPHLSLVKHNLGIIKKSVNLCFYRDEVIVDAKKWHDSLLIICYPGSEITLLSGDGEKKSTFFDCRDYGHTLALHVTANMDVIVGLGCTNGLQENTFQNKVVRIGYDRNQLQVITIADRGFDLPFSLATLTTGQVIVVDWGQGIKYVNPNNGLISPWNGDIAGEMRPTVVTSYDGVVFVTDYKNHKVFAIKENGGEIRCLLNRRHGLHHPFSAAVGPNGWLFVSCQGFILRCLWFVSDNSKFDGNNQ